VQDLACVATLFLCFVQLLNASELSERFSVHEVKISDAFDVKPVGSQHTHEEKWDDFTCRFTYIANGGTKEKWLMSFTRSKEAQEYECIVERREKDSYLFFQKFELQVGKNFNLIEGAAKSPDGSKDIFAVAKKKRMVTNKKGYQGLMTRVEAYAKRLREEL